MLNSENFFQDDGSSSDNHNLGLALVSSEWFWVTLILCSALLAVVTFSLWQHGQLQVFRAMSKPTDEIALNELQSEAAQPENDEQKEAPKPTNPPNLNAWPDEPQPLAEPEPTHRVCMTPAGSQLNRPLPSLHRNDSYRSVSGRESHQLISETARILLEMEEMRNRQQRKPSQATFEPYDVCGSYASGLDQPTGWAYRPGSSQPRRTSSMRKDWSLPPLPDRVSTLPRRAHQH